MSIALYRKYRPDRFQDVIGQDHVTQPLMAGLKSGRINHAYLFSGPRGCGKTTSARIMARCLNCEQGPTPDPCGQCESCVELATGGPGSLDVVEIDAASHNSVDDARELVDKAAFGPVRDRFKIFILDEAHMVTPQGFNALLKTIEEPPEHVKFILATTEPEKVLSTIRSRTHHYPFRLVAPGVLEEYLAEVCAREGIQPESGVLQMVLRAGGGSVRDSLSVLDQLMAGADGEGVISYSNASALLGYTDSSLLERAGEALVEASAVQLFSVVADCVAAGQDARRFMEDLLFRLRDLMLLAVSETQNSQLLEQIVTAGKADWEPMTRQARSLGVSRLSRVADAVSLALTELSSGLSAQLQLEFLAARMIAAAENSSLRAQSEEAEAKPERGPSLNNGAAFEPEKSAGDLAFNRGYGGATKLAGQQRSGGSAPGETSFAVPSAPALSALQAAQARLAQARPAASAAFPPASPAPLPARESGVAGAGQTRFQLCEWEQPCPAAQRPDSGLTLAERARVLYPRVSAVWAAALPAAFSCLNRRARVSFTPEGLQIEVLDADASALLAAQISQLEEVWTREAGFAYPVRIGQRVEVKPVGAREILRLREKAQSFIPGEEVALAYSQSEAGQPSPVQEAQTGIVPAGVVPNADPALACAGEGDLPSVSGPEFGVSADPAGAWGEEQVLAPREEEIPVGNGEEFSGPVAASSLEAGADESEPVAAESVVLAGEPAGEEPPGLPPLDAAPEKASSENKAHYEWVRPSVPAPSAVSEQSAAPESEEVAAGEEEWANLRGVALAEQMLGARVLSEKLDS